MTISIDGIEGLRARTGDHLGYSEWHQINQDQINTFADATGDHQWIHIDAERAATGPFGATVAHGYLTLSLAPLLLSEIYSVSGIGFALNYGLNKVRFPAPVPVGSKVRAGAQLESVEDVAGGVQVTLATTFELEGGAKPACVAEVVFRYLV